MVDRRRGGFTEAVAGIVARGHQPAHVDCRTRPRSVRGGLGVGKRIGRDLRPRRRRCRRIVEENPFARILLPGGDDVGDLGGLV